MLNKKRTGFVMAGGLVVLSAAGALAVSGALSVTNVAWLGTFVAVCAGSLIAMQRSSSPQRSIAEVLYDTENAGGSRS